jgi:hypothetical protein
MRQHLEQLIESMQQGDGQVVVDVTARPHEPARDHGLVAVLFVLGQEMYECPVSGAEATRLADAGARLTRAAQQSLRKAA